MKRSGCQTHHPKLQTRRKQLQRRARQELADLAKQLLVSLSLLYLGCSFKPQTSHEHLVCAAAKSASKPIPSKGLFAKDCECPPLPVMISLLTQKRE